MRYIDADDLKAVIKANDWSNPVVPDVVCLIIDRSPTVDVVPKSEVEKLICKLECLLCHVTGGRLSKHTYDLATMETVATDYINETYNDGYGEGYKDCATEIFAEIESNIYPMLGLENDKEYVAILATTFAELKKKYTEGEPNGENIKE